MKPKDLKFPRHWTQEAPLWCEGVFLLPKFVSLQGFLEKQPISKGVFERNRESLEEMKEGCRSSFCLPKGKIKIEYCSGNGDWIVEKAAEEPFVTWIAVEKRFDRVQKIWSKMKNREIENLKIVCAEALAFGWLCLSEGLVEEVFVNFPDPWPKQKHAKHRLIQSSFALEMERVITRGGKVTLVTDDYPYAVQMIATMLQTETWTSLFPPCHYTTIWKEYGTSWFQELWNLDQRTNYYMQFQKRT